MVTKQDLMTAFLADRELAIEVAYPTGGLAELIATLPPDADVGPAVVRRIAECRRFAQQSRDDAADHDAQGDRIQAALDRLRDRPLLTDD